MLRTLRLHVKAFAGAEQQLAKCLPESSCQFFNNMQVHHATWMIESVASESFEQHNQPFIIQVSGMGCGGRIVCASIETMALILHVPSPARPDEMGMVASSRTCSIQRKQPFVD